MISIRPVSDLRNKFTDIEKCVQGGDPVYLTKNGCGTMVVMSIEAFERREELYKLKARLAAAEHLRLSGHRGISMEKSRARVEELFMDYVKVYLAECDPQSYPGGVILSGGVANTPGIKEMLEDILGMQVRVAEPVYAMPPGREDPAFVSSAGLLRYLSYQERDAYLFIPPPQLPNVGAAASYSAPEADEGRSIRSLERSGENLRGFMKTLMDRFGDLF